MLAYEISSRLALNRHDRLLMSLCMGCLMGTQVDAGAIRKIVDEKGVTFFTNQPAEDDPLQRPGPVAPAVSASVPLAASAPAPARPSSAPVNAPLPGNPAKALGDWPPRSLAPTPTTAPPK